MRKIQNLKLPILLLGKIQNLKSPALVRVKIQNRVKWALGLWFRVRYRRRHAHLCLERIAGFDLLILPEVFNPALFGSSAFLADYVLNEVQSSKIKVQSWKNRQSSIVNRQFLAPNPQPPTPVRALDLGCGSGLLGLAAARAGAQVIATDINPQAVWVTGINAKLNGLQDRVEARQGNLFEAVEGEKFDLILNNPPYYSRNPENLLEHAFFAGPQQEVLVAMAEGLADHLAPDGVALMVVTSTISMETALKAAAEKGLHGEIVARRRYWAEHHLIYAFRHKI